MLLFEKRNAARLFRVLQIISVATLTCTAVFSSMILWGPTWHAHSRDLTVPLLPNRPSIPEPEDIKENNAAIIDELRSSFDGQDLFIVAKGPSAKAIKRAIGVNQAVLLTDRSILFINDFISLFGIEDVFPQIKYVFMPDFPHSSDLPSFRTVSRKDYRYASAYLTKFGFAGKVYIYQMQSTHNNHTEHTLKSQSTTDVPIALFNLYFNISSTHVYGYQRGDRFLYHPFIDVVQSNLYRHSYNNTAYADLADFYKKWVAEKERALLQPLEQGIHRQLEYALPGHKFDYFIH